MKKQETSLDTSKSFINGLHKSGRIFTLICLCLIVLVPVIYCIVAKVTPIWSAIIGSWGFILSYVAVGLIEAISYAPVLGVGGQYLAFITGNISNLKLPCSLNTQNIVKTEPNSEEQEIVATISIAVSSIVTTLIIIIGLIPLAIFGGKIVTALEPMTPYIIPAIFGGLGLVLVARYFKLTIIPFGIMLVTCLVAFLLKKDIGQSTALTIGMIVSVISGFAIYFIDKKKGSKGLKSTKAQGSSDNKTTKTEGSASDKATATENDNDNKATKVEGSTKPKTIKKIKVTRVI